MEDPLQAVLEAVHDETSFLNFVAALADDFEREAALEAVAPSSPYGPGALGWENRTVDAVLEAAEAWGRDSHGLPHLHPPGQNPWRRCAEILYAGKYYE